MPNWLKMKARSYAAVPALLGTLGVLWLSVTLSFAELTPPKIGAYDPLSALTSVDGLRLDHVFMPWHSVDKSGLRKVDRAAWSRGRDLLVTVEPFLLEGESRETMFQDIRSGVYDGRIRAVCRELGSFRSSMLIRWGHEMDDPSGRYPWAQQDAEGYISAYRYFVKRCRKLLSNARFVWSPMGMKNLSQYYPGGAAVDYIGLPIWGFQKWDMHYFGHTRTLLELIDEKYRLVKQYKKPVIIAEFGVAGERSYKRAILSEMRHVARHFPRIQAIVYFNMKEPYFWPNGFGSPDWRVPPRMLARFIPSFGETAVAATGE